MGYKKHKSGTLVSEDTKIQGVLLRHVGKFSQLFGS